MLGAVMFGALIGLTIHGLGIFTFRWWISVIILNIGFAVLRGV